MTHRILLADDSVTIRKVVELTFSDEDFTIDSVGDGTQAFEHARAQRPDVIISDVAMPGLNGYELCRRVKSDPNLQSVPFLFLKGTFESFDEEQARSSGADGFIVKPFESQEMIAKVKDLIARTVPAARVEPVQPPLREAAPVLPAPARPLSPPAAAQTPVPPRALPSSPTTATVPAAAPRPVAAPPRPMVQQRSVVVPPGLQQRPVAAPPPIPAMQNRAAPTPPATPGVAPRPAPPIPPRPVRHVAAMPPPAPPPVYQPPPPPLAAQAPVDDFGFDFGESDGDRFGTLAAQPEAHNEPSPPLEPSGESDEDLWSEVSLRGNASDLLEVPASAAFAAASPANIVDLTEESAPPAPDVLFEDEAVFEEVSTARRAPVAAAAEPSAVREEAPRAPTPTPTATPGPAAPIALDQDEIERIVASRVEAAVRKVLEPIVSELARTMIESVAWEVIPDLAEAMIRAEIERVRQSTRTD